MAVTTQDWLQAQNSVLGSALIEPELVPKLLTETSEEDFSGPCVTVYKAMRRLFLTGAPVDVVSLSNALGQEYRKFLMELMEITPTAAHIDHYIQLCREQARHLAVQSLARDMLAAENVDEMRRLLEKANGLMVERPSIQITNMSQALKSFMERHTRQVSYLTWPIGELNGELYAEAGDFIVFGGRPSAGKSAMALQCAWHWAQRQKVGFFSLETSAEKLFDRQMSGVARISMGDIKRNTIPDAAWNHLAAINQDIVSTNLELIRAAGMTVADIRAMTVQKGYRLIIVDYLQLIESSGSNRTEQVTAISIGLHTLAQSLGVTVVALSQLNRPDKQSKNQAQDMSALRESGQIEQDADIVMMLRLEDADKPSGDRILDIVKNKEGTCPAIKLAFDGRYQTFYKAHQTGETMAEINRIAKREKRKRAEQAQNDGQFSMMEDDLASLPPGW
ncbi:MAG: AAA family ATPase [Oscillospiraceae bacterium]|nr:AAA family ATPase [Oscillospiraceae bacterium]